MKMKRIGYLYAQYPEVRCIINRGGKECTYVRIGKLRRILLFGWRACEVLVARVTRRSLKTNWDIRSIYKTIISTNADVIHTFNTVCDTDTPWVSTFETVIPRTTNERSTSNERFL